MGLFLGKAGKIVGGKFFFLTPFIGVYLFLYPGGGGGGTQGFYLGVWERKPTGIIKLGPKKKRVIFFFDFLFFWGGKRGGKKSIADCPFFC